MKKILTLIIALIAAIAAQAAATMHYAQLKAVATPTGGGLVYADTVQHEGTFAATSDAPEVCSDYAGEDRLFYAYAQPTTGYGFRGWADAANAAIFSRSNPLEANVDCATENNGHSYRTVYAQFVRLRSVDLGFLLPMTVNDELGGGTYSAVVDGRTLDVSTRYQEATTSSTVTLTATAAPGYKFFGWYTSDEDQEKTFFAYDNPLTDYPFSGDCELGAMFVGEDTPIFRVGQKPMRYWRLEDAIAACTSAADTTIALAENGTLHDNHTIPAGKCLLIPFDDYGHCYKQMPRTHTKVNEQQEHARLTLASDAHLTVLGEVSVSAKMRSGNGGALTGCGNTDGQYGRLHLEEGAQLTLGQGGKLYAWGFVTGQGEIIAESGATVYEGFHFPVFRGGSAMSDLGGNRKRVFPVNQYYIQQIEAPLTLRYGSKETVVSTAYADDKINDAEAVFIGAGGLYEPAEGTSVRKHYNPLTDRISFDINGDTRLDRFDLSIAGYIINSESYALPITNNMTIRIHSGNTLIVNDLALLPGALIEVDNGATVTIGQDSRTYVYDREEWLLGQFAYPGQMQPAVYSPTRTYDRTTADLADARIDVNGTVNVVGQLFTTAGHADICSTQGTGRIKLSGAVQDTITTYQAEQNGATITYTAIACDAAVLRNGNGTYTETAGQEIGTTVTYQGDHWMLPSSSIVGDVNMDGSVDVSDISTLAEYIFGNTPAQFNADAADANGDGSIDVSDISTIAEIIFQQ